MVGRTPEIEGLVAIRPFPDTRELRGTIVMHLNHQRLAGRIHKLAHIDILARQFDAGIRPLHNKCTRGIVTTRSTYRIDKSLLVGHQHLYLCLRFRLRFVETCKQQMLVVVLESLGYLRPKPFHLLAVGLHRRFRDVFLKRALYPATVPVVVQQHIQSVLHAVVHNLLHASHPSGIDGHAFLAIDDMAHHPGCWNAYRLESLCSHEINNLLRRGRTLPGLFCTKTTIVGVHIIRTATFQRIAQIPPWIHLGSNLNRIGKLCKADGAIKHRQHQERFTNFHDNNTKYESISN